MLLTITCKGTGATDLSWLLRKRPERFQEFNLAYGRAFAFFPEYDDEHCTACLLLEVDQTSLNELCKAKDGEFQFVNPRQFLSSSLLAGAISRVFSSALKGICEDRPGLIARQFKLEAEIANFSCRHDPACIEGLFGPLGYAAEMEGLTGDGRAAGLGNLRLAGFVTLQDLLEHLFILLPVFDRQLHFWLGETQLQKFIRHSQAWLGEHPQKNFIINEYFWPAPELKYRVMEHFDALKARNDETPALNDLRIEAIAACVAASGARTVIDLGCGDGALLARLAAERRYERLVGIDVCAKRLEAARNRVAYANAQAGIELFAGSLTYRDRRLSGYDMAVLCEVIEHFEPARMRLVMDNILGEARPGHLIVSTPNRAYNVEYAGLADGGLRHPDHRHEFDAAEFLEFGRQCAARNGYEFELSQIGKPVPGLGAPTLLGVFRKCA